MGDQRDDDRPGASSARRKLTAHRSDHFVTVTRRHPRSEPEPLLRSRSPQHLMPLTRERRAGRYGYGTASAVMRRPRAPCPRGADVTLVAEYRMQKRTSCSRITLSQVTSDGAPIRSDVMRSPMRLQSYCWARERLEVPIRHERTWICGIECIDLLYPSVKIEH